MTKDSDDRLSTEQYTDMYRRLPHNSSTRRRIESLLNDEVRRSSSRYHVGGVNPESNQSTHTGNQTFIPHATPPVETPHKVEKGETLSTMSDQSTDRYTPSRYDSFFGRDPFFGSFFDDQFKSLHRRMDDQFNRMRQELFRRDDSETSEGSRTNNHVHGGNYAFSKKTHTHTFVDADGKKYVETNVKTRKNTNGETSTSSKRVLRKGDEEVTVITHNDGRKQVVGNEKLLDEFPEQHRHVTRRSSTNDPRKQIVVR